MKKGSLSCWSLRLITPMATTTDGRDTQMRQRWQQQDRCTTKTSREGGEVGKGGGRENQSKAEGAEERGRG